MKLGANQVCEDLLVFLGRIKSELIELAEERDLTVVQLFTLFAINREGNLAMGRVAEILRCDASNVTGIVDRLVQRSLVTRSECANDRRTKTIELTPKGKDTMAELAELIPARLGCERLSPDELRSFHAIIQKISV